MDPDDLAGEDTLGGLADAVACRFGVGLTAGELRAHVVARTGGRPALYTAGDLLELIWPALRGRPGEARPLRPAWREVAALLAETWHAPPRRLRPGMPLRELMAPVAGGGGPVGFWRRARAWRELSRRLDVPLPGLELPAWARGGVLAVATVVSVAACWAGLALLVLAPRMSTSPAAVDLLTAAGGLMVTLVALLAASLLTAWALALPEIPPAECATAGDLARLVAQRRPAVRCEWDRARAFLALRDAVAPVLRVTARAITAATPLLDGARFVCRGCGYDLRASPGPCPECGLDPWP